MNFPPCFSNLLLLARVGRTQHRKHLLCFCGKDKLRGAHTYANLALTNTTDDFCDKARIFEQPRRVTLDSATTTSPQHSTSETTTSLESVTCFCIGKQGTLMGTFETRFDARVYASLLGYVADTPEDKLCISTSSPRPPQSFFWAAQLEKGGNTLLDIIETKRSIATEALCGDVATKERRQTLLKQRHALPASSRRSLRLWTCGSQRDMTCACAF